MTSSSSEKGELNSEPNVSRIKVILNKINQIEFCNDVNDCARTLQHDETSDDDSASNLTEASKQP